MITFIIPCYNEEDNIKNCISSIKNEAKYIPHEIIVIDNDCTDNTASIAEKEGVRVIKETRKGVVFARQTGYENASYDFIANIDADSRLYEGWIWVAMKNISKENVVAVTGPLVYDDGSFFLRIVTKIYYWFAMKSLKYVGVFLQGGNCMIKKSVLDKVQGYDLSIAFYGEDTMTAKRIKPYGKIVFDKDLITYSSSRRIKQQGLIKTTWLYMSNYFSVTYKNISTTKDYKDYR